MKAKLLGVIASAFIGAALVGTLRANANTLYTYSYTYTCTYTYTGADYTGYGVSEAPPPEIYPFASDLGNWAENLGPRMNILLTISLISDSVMAPVITGTFLAKELPIILLV
jgi:hypothetical protein